MKGVLISIKPKWCELILQGKKTIEVRKNVPYLQTPFNCFIYCTKGNTMKGDMVVLNGNTTDHLIGNGHVIGEFVCDEIITFEPRIYEDDGSLPWYSDCIIYAFDNRICLSFKQFNDYAKGKTVYGWHISQLKIYDHLKELSDFCAQGGCDYEQCRNCKWFYRGNGFNLESDCDAPFYSEEYHPITRPPQSWCYLDF